MNKNKNKNVLRRRGEKENIVTLFYLKIFYEWMNGLNEIVY